MLFAIWPMLSVSFPRSCLPVQFGGQAYVWIGKSVRQCTADHKYTVDGWREPLVFDMIFGFQLGFSIITGGGFFMKLNHELFGTFILDCPQAAED